MALVLRGNFTPCYGVSMTQQAPQQLLIDDDDAAVVIDLAYHLLAAANGQGALPTRGLGAAYAQALLDLLDRVYHHGLNVDGRDSHGNSGQAHFAVSLFPVIRATCDELAKGQPEATWTPPVVFHKYGNAKLGNEDAIRLAEIIGF